LWYNMKIDYDIRSLNPRFDLDNWLLTQKKGEVKKSFFYVEDINEEYKVVLANFRSFLNSIESVTDQKGIPLTPINIYNAINFFKIRIEKLNLIFNLRLYKTYNVNKISKVRYIVMRAFWISDETGKPIRHFSRNIGAENKVLSNGKIPKHMIESIEDDILTLMWDAYQAEYLDAMDRFLTGTDQDGNFIIINDD